MIDQEVALHPEGVDRNIVLWLPPFLVTLSPSTRRAWIEMITEMVSAGAEMVALHPEGVDRNCPASAHSALVTESPSTRRAWIEM